jgi:hypothetical protein
MPAVVPFYSLDEESNPPEKRVYHNHTDCPSALAIPRPWRHIGTAGYNLCPTCLELIQRVRRKRPKSVT